MHLFQFKAEVNIVKLSIIILYMSLSDFFGLINFSHFYYGGLYLYDIIFISTLIIVLLVLYTNRKITISRPLSLLMVYSFVWALFIMFELVWSVFRNGTDPISAIKGIKFFVYMASIFVTYYGITSEMNANDILRLLLVLETISAILYVFQFITQIEIMHKTVYTFIFAVGDLSFIRTFVGKPIAPLFWIIFLAEIRKRELITFRVYTLLALLFGVSIIATLTRGEMIVDLSLLLLYHLITARKKILSLVSILALGIAISSTTFFQSFYRYTMNDIRSNDSNFTMRLDIITERVSRLLEKRMLLFGYGPRAITDRTVVFNARGRQDGIYVADSLYGTLLGIFGVIGTMLYATYFLLPIIDYYKYRYTTFSHVYIPYMIGILSLLVLSFEGSMLIERQYLFFYSLVIGLLLSTEKSKYFTLQKVIL